MRTVQASKSKSDLVDNSNSRHGPTRKPVFTVTDNRSEIITQRKLKEMAQKGSGIKTGIQLQFMANNSTVRQGRNVIDQHGNSQAGFHINGSSARPVLQRMLLQLGSDIAQDMNAKRLRESNPIEFRDAPLNNLVQGEVLHLLAHSGGNYFAGLKPYDLFEYLVIHGLPGNVSAIQLHGCESTGFATMLEHFLNIGNPQLNWVKPKGKPVKVKGIPGYSIVSTTGRNYSIGGTKGNDRIWREIGESVNRNPSNDLLKSYQKRYPGEIRKIKRYKSYRDVKGKVFGIVLESLAKKVDNVELDNFARQELISLGKMVDRVISIMKIQINPLGNISISDHVGKIQNDIRKKLREINPNTNKPAKESVEDTGSFMLPDLFSEEMDEEMGGDDFDFSFDSDLLDFDLDQNMAWDDDDDPFAINSVNEIDIDAQLAELDASLAELNKML